MGAIINQPVIHDMDKNKRIALFCDPHLGCYASQADILLQIIKELLDRYPDLIVMIVGDLYDGQNFELRQDELKLATLFQILAGNGQLILIRGDHDNWLENNTAESFYLPVHDMYLWRIKAKVHCAIHGHQEDSFFNNNRHLSKIFLLPLYYFFQILARLEVKLFTTQFLYQGIDWAKSCRGWWLKESRKSAKGIVNYVSGLGVDIIYGAHLHLFIRFRCRVRIPGRRRKKKIRYINIGGSPDLPFRYLLIKNNKFKTKKVGREK